jgi:uncharacterized protein with von Willebrand factor type A (vWA) domain
MVRLEHFEDLAAAIVEFCRFLRTQGFSADARQTMTALEAAKTIDVANQQLFPFALETALCSTLEEWENFPHLFQSFWGEPHARSQPTSSEKNPPPKDGTRVQKDGPSILMDRRHGQPFAQDGAGRTVYGASAQQRLRKVDFSEASCEDIDLLEKLSLRLMRRMNLRLSRKLVAGRRACRVDLRRTIRKSITSGGDPIVLAYKQKKPRRNRLVILLDVSGSMNLYSFFLLRFAYALQGCFESVHTFLFSTHLVEISDLLQTGNLPDALRRLAQRAAGWSGGTRIGESLSQFNRAFGKRLLSREAVFIILSDGWDTGEPELLTAQLRSTKQRVRKVVWLNPLLGLDDYEPVTRGMAAALPFVDIFAPAHNLDSLLALERLL